MATALAGCFAAAATIPFVSKKQMPARPDGNSIHELKAKVAIAAGAMASIKDPDARLLKLCREWWAQKRKTDALFAAIDETSDDVKRQEKIASESDNINEALLIRIAKQRAQTVKGFGAKMHVLGNCGASSIDSNSTYNDDRLIVSIVADSERIFRTSDDPIAPQAEDDPVVEVGRKLERTSREHYHLDDQKNKDVFQERECDHLFDEMTAFRDYLPTLKPTSVEGVALLISAAFYFEGTVEDEGYSKPDRERAHRQCRRALWSAFEFLQTEFAIDGDVIGVFRLMNKHLNPWLTADEAHAVIAADDDLQPASS